jgi:hypothetical protein
VPLPLAFRRMRVSWGFGLALGCYWLALNVLLDLLVLVPLVGVPIGLIPRTSDYATS